MHGFHRPSGFDEPAGQPVEQFRMIGGLAEPAEIVGRADDPFAEMPEPDPVHHHPGGQRMIGARQPVPQLEGPLRALSTTVPFAIGQGRGKASRDLLAERQVAAPDVNPDVDRLPILDAHRDRDRRGFLLELREARALPAKVLGQARTVILLGCGPGLLGQGVDLRLAARDFLPKRLDRRLLGLRPERALLPHGDDLVVLHRPGGLEDAGHPVVVGGRDRVELVVVASGTAHREAHEHAADRIHLLVDDVHLHLHRIVLGEHLRPEHEEPGRDQRVPIDRLVALRGIRSPAICSLRN